MPVIHQESLLHQVRVRLAIAQSTAQLYALIANNTPNDVPLTMAEYQQNVTTTMKHYAGEYLRTIGAQYQNTLTREVAVNDVTPSGFSVSDNKGHELVNADRKATLRYQGVDWLGNGHILGKVYFVELNIIEAPQPAVIAADGDSHPLSSAPVAEK